MPILFQKGILCTSNYNDMEHKPEIDGVTLDENTTKEDLDLDSIYTYRGQVPTYDNLPTSGIKNGDVYNVEDTGRNYAWDEKKSKWDDIGGIRITDIQDSKKNSFVNGEIATIPNASTQNLGLVKVNANQGIGAFNGGDLCTIPANDSEIEGKTQQYKPIVPNKLEKAIKEGLGNYKGTAWTDAYKNTARNTIGAQKTITGEAGKVVYTTATAGTVEAQSLMDFNYVTTTTTEFDSCKQSAPHTAYIINLQNSTVYAYDNEEENWIAQTDTPTAIIGAGRFSFNRITTKLFFCTGNEILHMSTATLDAGGVEG